MIDRKKWFAENQWFLKAIENGEEVEFSDLENFSRSFTEYADGFDLNDDSVFIYRSYYTSYRYARPIPKKKMRPMTREEVLIFLIDRPRVLLRVVDAKVWSVSGAFAFNQDSGHYEYIEIPEGYKGDFSDLEAKKFEVEE